MRDVICGVVDHGDFLEVQAGYAHEHRRRLRAASPGRTVGIIANQPLGALPGALDINASDKAARVHPLLQRVQHPAGHVRRRARASCPASQQEHGGIIRHGAKLLFAYSAATVPKITVILRKSYGGALRGHVLARTSAPTACFAWPTAEIAVMGAEGAAEIVFRKEMPRPRTRRRAAQS